MRIDWKALCIAMMTSIVVTTVLGLLLSIVIFPQSPWECFTPSAKSSITIAQSGSSGFNIHYVPLSQVIMGAFLIGTMLTFLFYFVLILSKKRKGKNEWSRRK